MGCCDDTSEAVDGRGGRDGGSALGGLFFLQFIAVRKMLAVIMRMSNMFPPGRVLWAMRDSDLHPSHRSSSSLSSAVGPSRAMTKTLKFCSNPGQQEKLQLFEVVGCRKGVFADCG